MNQVNDERLMYFKKRFYSAFLKRISLNNRPWKTIPVPDNSGKEYLYGYTTHRGDRSPSVPCISPKKER